LHEFFFAEKLINSILDYVDKNKVEKVKSVHIELGELLGIKPKELIFAYNILTKGTKIDNVKLIIHKVKGKVYCKNCNYSGNVKVLSYEHLMEPKIPCPKCNSLTSIVKGNECKILKIEI